MFKLIGKKIIAILHLHFLLNWPYDYTVISLCILGIANWFVSSATFYLQIYFFKQFFQEYLQIISYNINSLHSRKFCILFCRLPIHFKINFSKKEAWENHKYSINSSHAFLSSAIFFKINFLKNIFREYHKCHKYGIHCLLGNFACICCLLIF